MKLNDALEAARANRESVLVTIRRNGRPQLSNVLHAVDEDGMIRISTTADRAKFKNLQREPWAALHLNGENHWSYAVVEGDVTLSDVAAEPDDAAVEELVELYRSLAGEHDDWDDYRAAMVSEQRAVVRIRPTRAYGALRGT
jgi:PPOX class probable F420-dependent enzyme